MVNNPNPRKLVSGACIIKQSCADDRQRITNGPVYDLKVVKTLVKNHGFVVINDKAREDQKEDFVPSLSADELKKIIGALESAHFHGSERCLSSSNMIIDADGYVIRWVRSRMCEAANNETGCKVYIKFGFRGSNPKCLILSIHN